MINRVSIRIGEEDLILETGRMAKQANGSVFATYGGSSVLATVCCSAKEGEKLDFVPLSVDYNEKYYAAGKIPGGFLKREGRPKDKEILVSRLIDRPMRPLFYKEFGREIQVIPTTVSTDQINPPDVIGMVAAFAAVSISDIPFNGPVAAVRVALVGDDYIVNPTFEQISKSRLDIVVAGTNDGITMVEGGGKEVSEEQMISAIEKAEPVLKQICAAIVELSDKVGNEKLSLPVWETVVLEQEDAIKTKYYSALEEACFVIGKHIRYKAIKDLKLSAWAEYGEEIGDENKEIFSDLFAKWEKEIVRSSILNNKKRTDHRNPEEIRNITTEVNVLDRTHGSALFTRGETQALAVATLGTVFDEQIMDDIDGDKRAKFMLHYNFPPFSVGETGRMGTGRREIGHGHLAQRAIEGVLPETASFPYTLRIVSEILESNGSSSMATVCGSSMCLQNAGVPIRKPVAGIAMGLISEGDDYVILSDILGEEDHLGDMDFKVAGTEDGITAFQMDIKISNVSRALMEKALDQAKRGRMHILGKMSETIHDPAEDVSELAPKIISMKIDPDKIGMVIGPGGKNIKAISESCDASINIEDDGTVTIYGKKRDGARMAETKLRGMIEDPEEGRVYDGTVKRIVDFGAFIEILPNKEGLCHISKLSTERVGAVTDVLKEGDAVKVRLVEIDKMGRLNLSIVDVDEEVWKKRSQRPGGSRPQKR
ncbi:polyribonucleotide nucleotidyltransferase [Spirochaeta cellobiosiphila]|uniref:polyribonucleotide nucleotidyltransferase n=1 Tax=Spirochaeta cellobiosiphila TaxID=504483 RepID=UPI0003FC5DB5|nr:polyribonucleotide nucleotidyltransferase [Spirochaeta cellobiosiphila]